MASESQLDKKIQKYCKDHNIWQMKVWGSGMQRSGIPDLLICYRGRFVGLETKVGKNKMSELQKYEVRKINESGGYATDCYTYEEFLKVLEDLDNGTI